MSHKHKDKDVATKRLTQSDKCTGGKQAEELLSQNLLGTLNWDLCSSWRVQTE